MKLFGLFQSKQVNSLCTYVIIAHKVSPKSTDPVHLYSRYS